MQQAERAAFYPNSADTIRENGEICIFLKKMLDILWNMIILWRSVLLRRVPIV